MPHQSVSSIGEQIIKRLRGELLSGLYEPGSPLREEGLADRFGVSRMPIRHALQQLVHEGLLVAKRNCGVSVAPHPNELVRSLLTPLRAQIETYALGLALPRIASESAAEWEAILDTMELACLRKDDAEVIDQDFSFHLLLLTKAGLEEIIPVWKAVAGRMRDYHIDSNRRLDDYGVIPFIHRKLLEAFRTGDEESARFALVSHLENGEFNQRAAKQWRNSPARHRSQR